MNSESRGCLTVSDIYLSSYGTNKVVSINATIAVLQVLLVLGRWN
jgi:hypothetical protein